MWLLLMSFVVKLMFIKVYINVFGLSFAMLLIDAVLVRLTVDYDVDCLSGWLLALLFRMKQVDP